MPVWLASLFANPWMLLWIPVAAAPVVIHLWYRQQYREIRWAAMEYLLAAIEKSRRRMRIEQWLLLLVRIVLLLLLVLAIAEPLLRNRGVAPLAQDRTHYVFLLDSSYSMGATDGELSAFDRAKRQIADRVNAGQSGDGYSLIRIGDRAEVIVGQPSLDPPEFLSELKNVSLGQGGADLGSGLTAAQKVIDAEGGGDDFSQRSVIIFSDLGRTSWDDGTRRVMVAEKLEQQLARLAETSVIEVVPIQDGVQDNLAVVDLAMAGQVATVASPTEFIATLHSFSQRPMVSEKVDFWVDGIRVDQKQVDLPSGSDTQVAFAHQFLEAGPHSVSVRLQEDRLPIDNRRYLALDVKEQINILLIRGKRGAVQPLVAAIDNSESNTGRARVKVVDESQLSELDLNRFDVIFLCNVAQWTASEGERLRAYAEQGGGIVTILGDRVLTDRYNRSVLRPSDSNGTSESAANFLPATLGKIFYDGDYHFPDPRDYEHPMLKPWQGNPRTGLTGVPILEYFRLQIPAGSDARPILWLDTGDPLLVLTKIGRGWSLLLATDPSASSRSATEPARPWSLVASWLNAQPFFEGLWKAVIGGGTTKRNLQVGQWLQGRWDAAEMPDKLNLEIPQTPPREVELSLGPDATWSFGETERSGWYRISGQENSAGVEEAVRQNRSDPEAISYAVNLDTRESDLRRYAIGDLPAIWQPYIRQQISTQQGSTAPLAGQTASILFLWAVLFLLFVEVFLAWWIGNRFA